MNVRLLLLESTLLFISREAITRASLSATSQQKNKSSWTQVINLIWLRWARHQFVSCTIVLQCFEGNVCLSIFWSIDLGHVMNDEIVIHAFQLWRFWDFILYFWILLDFEGSKIQDKANVTFSCKNLPYLTLKFLPFQCSHMYFMHSCLFIHLVQCMVPSGT